MKPRDVLDLLTLGALWGSSFLFMRLAAPQFGPIALIAIRVSVAALLLLALLHCRGQWSELRQWLRPLTVLGALNSALPFTLFAYATLSLAAGYAAILNATAPLFGALIGALFLREQFAMPRAAGLLVGFLGVVLVVWHKLTSQAELLALAAGLTAGLAYGISAHYTKRKLQGCPPLVTATGTQVAAAVLLLPGAVVYWPAEIPDARGWVAAIVLGVACTALAYLLYFRLIASIGVMRAITVAYLIPLFAMIWGWVFLNEPITVSMFSGALVVLLGVALVTHVQPAALPSGTATSPERTQ